MLCALGSEKQGVEIGFAEATLGDLQEACIFKLFEICSHTSLPCSHVFTEPFLTRKTIVVLPCVLEQHGVRQLGSDTEFLVGENVLWDLSEPVASDGIEALAHLENETFDLVLTDVEMPRMDGFELTEHIRNHPTLANLAVLILTSLASDADRERGMSVGADGYIVKSSFDEQSLLAAVDRLVGAPV